MRNYEPMKFSEAPDSAPTAVTTRHEARPQRIWSRSVELMIRSDRWVFEQKMDGTRGLVVVSDANPFSPAAKPRVWWPGRGGRGALAHTAATQHFPAINPVLQRILATTPGELVFDGEIINNPGGPHHGEFHVFDCPYMRIGGVEVIRNEDSWAARHRALEAPDLLRLVSNTPVKVVRTARTPHEKAALLQAVIDEGGEGVMAKNVGGAYRPGERVGLDNSAKIKLVKTADVVVLTVNKPDPQHGSCTFGVVAPGQAGATAGYRQIGGCSLIGKPPVSPGDVIEVNYLYWTGSSLYQPRLVRLRPDKAPDECSIDQFRSYSRRVV